jgi:death-on-curing protein
VNQDSHYWRWIDAQVLLAAHDEQLAEHGGGSGVRDAGLFDSALARPQHLAAYETPDVADLAAAYGFGITRNHPFVDGNKRTAFVAMTLFLLLNGFRLDAKGADSVLTMLAVAVGEMTEPDFAAWIRAHSVVR